MYIPRKFTGFVIMALLLGGIGFLGATSFYTFFPYVIFFGIALAITALVINWVGNEKRAESQSRRKVEKLLRELDDDDLDLLRTRLMRDEQNVDDADNYSSMAELVQSGKRKNEV
jgi:hypothetical protein